MKLSSGVLATCSTIDLQLLQPDDIPGAIRTVQDRSGNRPEGVVPGGGILVALRLRLVDGASARWVGSGVFDQGVAAGRGLALALQVVAHVFHIAAPGQAGRARSGRPVS